VVLHGALHQGHRTRVVARADRRPQGAVPIYRYRKYQKSRAEERLDKVVRLANARLEIVMWTALHDVARRKGCSVDDLVTEIDAERKSRNLGAAIRNHLVEY
jgi:hypothetical protein